MSVERDLAFGAGGCRVPCGPSAPGGSDRRGYQRQEVRANITCFWRHSPLFPKAACSPKLLSRGEGVAGPGPAWPQRAGLRGEGGAARPGGLRGSHASFPQNCTVWDHLHSRGRREGSSRRGEAVGRRHALPLPHLVTGGASRGEIPRLCTDLGFMLRPSLVSSLI